MTPPPRKTPPRGSDVSPPVSLDGARAFKSAMLARLGQDSLRTFKKGEVLINEGDSLEGHMALLIVSGIVVEKQQRFIEQRGQIEVQLTRLGPQSFTIAQVLARGFTNKPSMLTAVAEEDGEAFMMDISSLPKESALFAQLMARELHRSAQLLEMLWSQRKVELDLAEARSVAERQGDRANGLSEALRLTQEQLHEVEMQALDTKRRLYDEAREIGRNAALAWLRNERAVKNQERLTMQLARLQAEQAIESGRTAARTWLSNEKYGLLEEKLFASIFGSREAFEMIERERGMMRAAFGQMWQRIEKFCSAMGIGTTPMAIAAIEEVLGFDTFTQPIAGDEVENLVDAFRAAPAAGADEEPAAISDQGLEPTGNPPSEDPRPEIVSEEPQLEEVPEDPVETPTPETVGNAPTAAASSDFPAEEQSTMRRGIIVPAPMPRNEEDGPISVGSTTAAFVVPKEVREAAERFKNHPIPPGTIRGVAEPHDSTPRPDVKK